MTSLKYIKCEQQEKHMCKCQEDRHQDILVRINNEVWANGGRLTDTLKLLQEAASEILKCRRETWNAEARAEAAEKELEKIKILKMLKAQYGL